MFLCIRDQKLLCTLFYGCFLSHISFIWYLVFYNLLIFDSVILNTPKSVKTALIFFQQNIKIKKIKKKKLTFL